MAMNKISIEAEMVRGSSIMKVISCRRIPRNCSLCANQPHTRGAMKAPVLMPM